MIGDRHPTQWGEAVRYPYCEGELLNAYGRMRAILREAETPCRIRLVFDTCLPITVDEVVPWQPPSQLVEVALEGVIPRLPQDLMLLWPQRFKTMRAARWALRDGVFFIPPDFVSIDYQLVDGRGRGGRMRRAYYNPQLISDPLEWLQSGMTSGSWVCQKRDVNPYR